MTYHEKVARKMADTYSVGSMNTYDEILEVCNKKSERELRMYIESIELRLKIHCGMPADWHFIEE